MSRPLSRLVRLLRTFERPRVEVRLVSRKFRAVLCVSRLVLLPPLPFFFESCPIVVSCFCADWRLSAFAASHVQFLPPSDGVIKCRMRLFLWRIFRFVRPKHHRNNFQVLVAVSLFVSAEKLA